MGVPGEFHCRCCHGSSPCPPMTIDPSSLMVTDQFTPSQAFIPVAGSRLGAHTPVDGLVWRWCPFDYGSILKLRLLVCEGSQHSIPSISQAFKLPSIWAIWSRPIKGSSYNGRDQSIVAHEGAWASKDRYPCEPHHHNHNPHDHANPMQFRLSS